MVQYLHFRILEFPLMNSSNASQLTMDCPFWHFKKHCWLGTLCFLSTFDVKWAGIHSKHTIAIAK